ncbi:plastocyanin/azurin family copper-binding protein [Verrucomicrobiales bacterium]|nr:plastocyanin/azurin family copper-binding protein [Verrucomicrobiales bacterium]
MMSLRFTHSQAVGSLLLLTILVLPVCSFAQKGGNVANPEKHPYADTGEGRAAYSLSGETVNEARLYEFYQRQADYYMSSSNETPAILPAYPGLDGGAHGHWGKHNQNNHEDGRWNDAEMGEVITQVLRYEKSSVLKAICLRVGDERELSACFDPMSLSYRSVWEGGFVSFQGFRWGTSRNAQLEGDPWYFQKKAAMPEGGEYLGYYRFGKRVVLSYKLKGTEIADEPWAVNSAFYRRIEFKSEALGLEIPMPKQEGMKAVVVKHGGTVSAFVSPESGSLLIEKVLAGSSVVIRFAADDYSESDEAALAHFAKERKPERRWKETLKVKGELGKATQGSSYRVDTITVPYDNPYHVVMQLSGIDFLENGDALVCTLLGDIWKVSGLDSGLEAVTWRRFATGFNQPVGIHIDQDGIFVLDRGQIYRLHDKNGDGEADFYENYANDFGGYDRSHTHTFGLHRTADGSFHFTQRESILQTGPDRKTVLQGWGVRNCMGIGGSDDYFWVAPQEGTWTPTSAIIEVNQGEFYGLPTKDGKSGSIAAPLCFIPRGVDNSTGGMVEVTSDKWGPFKGSHIGLSYGSGIHYLILRDAEGSRPQGAVVPLKGEFLSGSMRGAFHPEDGQLYLVGLDGWGDYSLKDGCFHRVRYTGDEVFEPTGFKVHENGIRIDFAIALDSKSISDLSRYFAHAWNYEYAKHYGSPEFSVKEPKSLGHDPVEIRSVVLLENGKSIFVEMPTMEPVMQHHIRMHLVTEEGKEFKTDLFSSPMYLGEYFAAEGFAKPNKSKPTAISLRVLKPENEPAGNTESGEVTEGERSVVVDAIGGLQYAQKEILAKPGEAIALTLRNTDVMPHNLVIVKPGAAKTVGDASFKMLNDPEAGRKHYVPDLPEVLHHIPVINPGVEHVLHFRAPTEPGDYPYICTFPGHWMAMNGVLKVK